MNGIKKLFGLGLVGLLGLLPIQSNADGRLEVQNNSPYVNVNDNYILFQEGVGDGTYNSALNPSMEIWYENENIAKCGRAGVNVSSPKNYRCPLQYGSGVSNGATNYLRFAFTSGHSFSNNVLFTYLVDGQNKKRIGDVRKKIVEGNNIAGREYLDNVPVGHSDWQIYGTNFVNIAPIETTVTNFVKNADGTVKIEGKARPGTVLWPEWSTNLVNWTSMSNQAKYVNVTTNNFGSFDGFSYTNLTSTNNPMFFRIGNDSYNLGTSNLLANSQALGVKTLESAVNVASPVTSSSPKSTFKILRYYNK